MVEFGLPPGNGTPPLCFSGAHGCACFQGAFAQPSLLAGPLWFGVIYRWLVGLGSFLQRSPLRGRWGGRHCPLGFVFGAWIGVPLPGGAAHVLGPLCLDGLLQRPPLRGGVVSRWLVALSGFLQCPPGDVIAPSGSVWVLRLAFSSLAASPMSWVLLALTAFSNALHSVGVPGGVVSPSGFGRVLWSVCSSLVVWAMPWVLLVSMAFSSPSTPRVFRGASSPPWVWFGCSGRHSPSWRHCPCPRSSRPQRPSPTLNTSWAFRGASLLPRFFIGCSGQYPPPW